MMGIREMQKYIRDLETIQTREAREKLGGQAVLSTGARAFSVWYIRGDLAREARVQLVLEEREPRAEVLSTTHQLLLEGVKADGLEGLYVKMQGHHWSPHGEARDLISSLGLLHTSMSVGDVAVDEDGQAWVVSAIGWRRI